MSRHVMAAILALIAPEIVLIDPSTLKTVHYRA